MEINANFLFLEVGRDCDGRCKHCSRGPAENVTMPLDMAFKAIDSFDNISQIVFTGGEPMLYADNIIKIIDYIIKNNKNVYGFYMATNGKHVSMPLMLKFAELYAYCIDNGAEDWECSVQLSNDQYHERVKISPVLRTFRFFSTKGDLSSLINEGYAKINEIGSHNLEKENAFEIDVYSDEIRIDYVYLNAKGYLFSNCDYSYETQEEIAKYTLKDIPNIIRDFADEVA